MDSVFAASRRPGMTPGYDSSCRKAGLVDRFANHKSKWPGQGPGHGTSDSACPRQVRQRLTKWASEGGVRGPSGDSQPTGRFFWTTVGCAGAWGVSVRRMLMVFTRLAALTKASRTSTLFITIVAWESSLA